MAETPKPQVRRKVPASQKPLQGMRDESWTQGTTGWETWRLDFGDREQAGESRRARLAPDLVGKPREASPHQLPGWDQPPTEGQPLGSRSPQWAERPPLARQPGHPKAGGQSQDPRSLQQAECLLSVHPPGQQEVWGHKYGAGLDYRLRAPSKQATLAWAQASPGEPLRPA